MAKELLEEISPNLNLYRDSKTGIATVQDGSTGLIFSCHPNIDATGSTIGMKKLGYWKKEDQVVRSGGSKYNISTVVICNEIDEIAHKHCKCGGGKCQG